MGVKSNQIFEDLTKLGGINRDLSITINQSTIESRPISKTKKNSFTLKFRNSRTNIWSAEAYNFFDPKLIKAFEQSSGIVLFFKFKLFFIQRY